MAEPHPHARTAPTPATSEHEAPTYHTPLWGWLILLVAVAMLGGLLAMVFLGLGAAQTSG